MPIYEYQCKKCQQYCEKLQKISDPVLVTCPSCGQDALSRVISAAGFQLKGSGWYVTDFRDKKTGQSTAEGAKSSNKTESSKE